MTAIFESMRICLDERFLRCVEVGLYLAHLLLSNRYCLGGVSYLASLQLQGDPSEANQSESVTSWRLVQSVRPKKMQVILFMKQNRASDKTFFVPVVLLISRFCFEKPRLKALAVSCYFVRRDGPYFALRKGEFLYLFR